MPETDRCPFVVLYHQMPPESDRIDHWDLMLCDQVQLLTWALDAPPQPGLKIGAIQLANHDLRYLEYEGLIGNGRGTVSRVMKGTYMWQQRDKHCLRAKLFGLAVDRLTITRQQDQRFFVEFFDGIEFFD